MVALGRLMTSSGVGSNICCGSADCVEIALGLIGGMRWHVSCYTNAR
jgi:hypothetical protein